MFLATDSVGIGRADDLLFAVYNSELLLNYCKFQMILWLCFTSNSSETYVFVKCLS